MKFHMWFEVLPQGISTVLVSHGLVTWLPVSHLLRGVWPSSQSRCISEHHLSSGGENRDKEVTGEINVKEDREREQIYLTSSRG